MSYNDYDDVMPAYIQVIYTEWFRYGDLELVTWLPLKEDGTTYGCSPDSTFDPGWRGTMYWLDKEDKRLYDEIMEYSDEDLSAL